MALGGDQTKSRLLAEAREHYLEGGLARFSLREVARRAGVSAAAVYRHYDGKEALIEELCAQGLQIFYAYLVRSLSEPSPHARLLGSAKQYLRFGLEHARDYRVLFMGAAEDFAQITSSKKETERDPTFQFLVDRVRECIAARVLRREDTERLAIVIWAHVHGLVSLRLSGQLARVGNDAEFEKFYLHATGQLV